MKHPYRMVLGLPAIALGGWVAESQAAEFPLDFQVTLAPAQRPAPEPADPPVLPPASDHPLNFTPLPPQSAPTQLPAREPDLAIATATDTNNVPLPVPATPVPVSTAPADLPPPPLNPAIADLFQGGSESLVARAVGSAEGTRTPQGQRTPAYYGHVDPGNAAWNLGSFSYQHGAQSPEEADHKQLARLQQQTLMLHQLAFERGMALTLPELLNGIDLANQAPIAALDRGYVDWLKQAKDMAMSEEEAILWARTRAFLDPDTGRWNAPGLGNSVQTVSADQARRQQAIAQALAISSPAATVPSPPSPSPKESVEMDNAVDSIIDTFIRLDLPQ